MDNFLGNMMYESGVPQMIIVTTRLESSLGFGPRAAYSTQVFEFLPLPRNIQNRALYHTRYPSNNYDTPMHNLNGNLMLPTNFSSRKK